jgi:hypothetical protein
MKKGFAKLKKGVEKSKKNLSPMPLKKNLVKSLSKQKSIKGNLTDNQVAILY